jgi:hypothetical protein
MALHPFGFKNATLLRKTVFRYEDNSALDFQKKIRSFRSATLKKGKEKKGRGQNN